MKIYLASSFSLIPRIEAVCKELESVGHEITVKWWERLHLKMDLAPLSPEVFYNHPETAYAYNRDFKGIVDADILVFVADEKERSFNGANVELGIALALNKPCFCVGVLPNSALYYPVIFTKDIQDLVQSIYHYEKGLMELKVNQKRKEVHGGFW